MSYLGEFPQVLSGRPPPLTGHTGGGKPVAVPEQTDKQKEMLNGCSDVTFVFISTIKRSGANSCLQGAEPQIIDQSETNSWS